MKEVMYKSGYLSQFSSVVEAINTLLAAYKSTHLLSHSCVGHKRRHSSKGASVSLSQHCHQVSAGLASPLQLRVLFQLLPAVTGFSSSWGSTQTLLSCWLSAGGQAGLLEASRSQHDSLLLWSQQDHVFLTLQTSDFRNGSVLVNSSPD